MELQIKIVQQNVIAWSFNRRNELCNYFQKISPDIILLNSIGITDKNIKIFGYNVHQKNKYNEAHAGIAIAIRQSMPYKIIDNFTEDFLGIKVSTRRGDIIIATTYLPPRRMHLFPTEDIMKILRQPLPAYLFGDLNASHQVMGHGHNNASGILIQGLITRDLATFLGPDFPTFFNARATGKPDILLSNRHHHLNYALQRGELTSSDHWPVILTLSTKPIIIEMARRHNTKQANWEGFKNELGNQIQEEEENIIRDKNYVDNKLEKWFTRILNARDNNIPTTAYRTLPHPLTSDKLKLIQWQHDRLNARANLLGWTIETRSLLKGLQTELINECTKIYTEAWSKLLKKIDASYNDSSKFWQQIKRLLGGGRIESPYITQNNVRLYKDEEKEEAFRNSWQTIFSITPEENARFDAEHETTINDFLVEHQEELLPFDLVDLSRLDPANPITRPTTTREVKKVISNFKNKAPGNSQINKELLKQLPDPMLDSFTETINETLSMGYFPKMSKKANLIFIGKKGKAQDITTNYRPISLLEVPGKVIEKLILQRLQIYLMNNNLINKNQYGFTQGRGTQVALGKMYEIIAMSQNQGKSCNVVSRDIQKAFDKVWHGGLKYKMKTANFPELLLKILCSFVDGRTAAITIGKFQGPEFPLLSGVPQGSILSPALFNFYTRDVPEPERNNHQFIFADDHTQVITHFNKRGKGMLALRTAREIKRVNDYEKLWKIATSREKFQLVSIAARKPHDVIVDGNIIPFKRHAKILGFTFGTHGFSPHFNARIRTANQTLTKLRRFRGTSTKTNLHLYKTLVRPQLEYPPILMGILSKSKMKKIQAVQNKALRRAFKQVPPYYNTTEDLHQQSKMEPLNQRLHRLSNKTWDNINSLDNELIDQGIVITQQGRRDHNCWRRLSPFIEGEQPLPIYRH